jgi:hypothetical protein
MNAKEYTQWARETVLFQEKSLKKVLIGIEEVARESFQEVSSSSKTDRS